MKIYCVSIVWIKHNTNSGMNIANNLINNIVANNENEAFGIAYDRSKDKFAEHQLFTKIVMEQHCSCESSSNFTQT